MSGLHVVLLGSSGDAALTFSGWSTDVESNGQIAATGRADMLSMANVTMRRVGPFILTKIYENDMRSQESRSRATKE